VLIKWDREEKNAGGKTPRNRLPLRVAASNAKDVQPPLSESWAESLAGSSKAVELETPGTAIKECAPGVFERDWIGGGWVGRNLSIVAISRTGP
jgi:hypothetical protein